MARLVFSGLLVVLLAVVAVGQSKTRKPRRAEPPKFSSNEFDSIFFENVASVLKGERPSKSTSEAANSSASKRHDDPVSDKGSGTASTASSASGEGWTQLIAASTIEDVIKKSKLRLDGIVTTPARFAGGGFAEARREFSLLAGLFAVIEQYPGQVRWKASAALARERFSRAAANAKVGSAAAFTEAKARVQELGDLLNGSPISGSPSAPVEWEHLIDRGPLMQVLEWTFKEHTQNYTASAAAFAQNKDELQQSVELISVLGSLAQKEGMPDAADAEYTQFAKMMVEQAREISVAVKNDNADAARVAAGQVGQSCVKCHDSYR